MNLILFPRVTKYRFSLMGMESANLVEIGYTVPIQEKSQDVGKWSVPQNGETATGAGVWLHIQQR